MADSAKFPTPPLVEHLSSRVGVSRSKVANLLGELNNFASVEFEQSGEFELPGMFKLSRGRCEPVAGRGPETRAEICQASGSILTLDVADFLQTAGQRSRKPLRIDGPEGEEISPVRPAPTKRAMTSQLASYLGVDMRRATELLDQLSAAPKTLIEMEGGPEGGEINPIRPKKGQKGKTV